MKIGVDIHGTADAFPEFFAEMTKLFVAAGHEVHIITGVPIERALKEIQELGLEHTHTYSITTHHQMSGTTMKWDEKGDPWMDEDVWNRAKAEYAEKVGLNIMLDDSNEYGMFFKTPYMRVQKSSSFIFTASTVDETTTAAAMMDDTDVASMTGKQVKEMASQLDLFRTDIEKCHEICNSLNIPDIGRGLIGLKKRLEYLREEIKTWEIWVEGFQATGQSGPASFKGTVIAKTFKDACDTFFRGDGYYDPKRMTYWGCRVFDNESDARRSFG